MSKEIEIGQELDLSMFRVRCVEEPKHLGCLRCSLFMTTYCYEVVGGKCVKYYRNDGKNVIFMKIEKQ